MKAAYYSDGGFARNRPSNSSWESVSERSDLGESIEDHRRKVNR
jgi:hypothetical protein